VKDFLSGRYNKLYGINPKTILVLMANSAKYHLHTEELFFSLIGKRIVFAGLHGKIGSDYGSGW